MDRLQVDFSRGWRQVSGDHSLTIGGVLVPNPLTVRVNPDDRAYVAQVQTLCGRDTMTVDGTPTESMNGGEFLRRIQLAGSIQHATNKGCQQCLDCYAHLSADERKWLHTTNPTLGALVGIGANMEAKLLLAASLTTRAGQA